MSRKHHKIATGDQGAPMSDPEQTLVLDTIDTLRAALARAREADQLSADDLAEARRVLYPTCEVVTDWKTWYADVGAVKRLLETVALVRGSRLPKDQADELRRIASEEDSAAAPEAPDMGSTAD